MNRDNQCVYVLFDQAFKMKCPQRGGLITVFCLCIVEQKLLLEDQGFPPGLVDAKHEHFD